MIENRDKEKKWVYYNCCLLFYLVKGNKTIENVLLTPSTNLTS